MKFDSFEIDASEATEVCGGLFGSIWTNVGLYFMGKDDTDDGTATKLNVVSAKINAPNAKMWGLGLSFQWKMGDSRLWN